MSEFIGLAYYTEVPTVFFNVQRTGPATGMPTRTQQGDLLLVAYASHGDTKHIVLFPCDPTECFLFAVEAFDLAERFQTPVFVVSDLDIGMNDWVCDELVWDDSYVPDRGKVLTAEQLEKMEAFHRYLDVDGDTVPYRTLPGVHPKGAYFTRGSGHDKWGRYTEDSAAYQEVVDRLRAKMQRAAGEVPAPEIVEREGATIGLIALGSEHRAVLEAMDLLEDRGVLVDYMRIRSFPFSDSVGEFIDTHEVVFVIEQNRDAQLRSLLLIETERPASKLLSLRRYAGMPLSARHVVEDLLPHLGASSETS